MVVVGGRNLTVEVQVVHVEGEAKVGHQNAYRINAYRIIMFQKKQKARAGAGRPKKRSVRSPTKSPLRILRQELSALGMRLVEKDLWPPSLPDINCLDFACWSVFKRLVKGVIGYPTLAGLKENIVPAWNENFIRMMMAKWRGRLMQIIVVKGDHFETKWQAPII